MSKQPANPKDLEELTEYWRRETNYVNQKVDDAFRAAQDHAYALGLNRGDEERSRLHAANAEMADALEHINGFVTGERVPRWDTREHVYASREAIANACGAALSKHKEQGGSCE
jgi:hypothetical protein